MKTTITNSIYFSDGLDTQLCRTFKKIFPDEDYDIWLYDFGLAPLGRGHYKMILEIYVRYKGSVQNPFTYTKTTSDMPLIDSIKNNENEKETAVITRRTIVNMISNDSFIEELEEFLETLNQE